MIEPVLNAVMLRILCAEFRAVLRMSRTGGTPAPIGSQQFTCLYDILYTGNHNNDAMSS